MKKRILLSLLFAAVLAVMITLLTTVSASADTYNLTVADTQVTTGNKDDILGDGKFRYNSSQKTLEISGSYLIVNVINIPAAELNDELSVVVLDDQGAQQAAITAVPLYYVKSVLNNPQSDPELVDLVKAIYIYNAAADAFFED